MGVRPQAHAAPPPQPAGLPQPGARAPPSTRPPGCLLPPPRSLPPPGGLGADSAARCSRGWKMAGNDCSALLDEELSSFFLNYLSDTQVRPAGRAGQTPGCRTVGLQRQLRSQERSGGRTGAIGGFRLQSPPSTCLALRSVTGVASCRSPAHAVALGDTVIREGLVRATWSLWFPHRQS